MVSQYHSALPEVLLKEIGGLLRQGRTVRRLSLAKAAYELKIDVDHLANIETGSIAFSGIVAQKISQFYRVHEAQVNAILFDWAIFQLNYKETCKRRQHLSLVGSSPKPWEKIPDSIAEIKNRRFL